MPKSMNIDLLEHQYRVVDPKEREFEKKKPEKVNFERLLPIYQDMTRVKIRS